MSSAAEVVTIPTPNRRLVTFLHMDADREITFIEVHAEELIDHLLSTMVGDVVWATTSGTSFDFGQKVMMTFVEEVGVKEIPITPPTDFIGYLNRKIEEEIKPRLEKLNMSFSYIVGENHIEFSLTIEDSASQETVEEEL